MTLPSRLVPLVLSLADLLDRLKLSYAFGGALANNYWGVVRATQDIDLLVMLPALRYQEAADAFTNAGFSMRSAEDLILLKMAFHRDKDLRDMRSILATQGERLDTAYLHLWAARMLDDRSSEELRNWMVEYGRGRP